MLFPIDPRIFGPPHLDGVSGAAFLLLLLGVTWLAAVRPSFAVAALVLVDPFDYARYLGTVQITSEKVAVLGAILGLAWFYARRRPRNVAWRDVRSARLLGVALLALIAATAVTYFQAELWWAWRDEMVKLQDDAAIFLTALAAGIADDDLGPLERAASTVLILVSALAISEEGTARSVVAMSGALVPRIAGPLDGPNHLSGYLQILIPLVAGLTLFGRPRVWLLIALFMGSLTDVLTLSRNGLACGAIAVAIVVGLGSGRRLPVILTLFSGCAFGMAIQPESLLRLGSTSQEQNAGTVGTRAILWRAAYQLWRTHPFLGIGAGNFEFEISRVGPAGVRTHANDWYLQALAEGGIPLLAATLLTAYASIASFVRGLREDPLVLSAFAVSVGLALASILDYVLFYPKIVDAWWLLLGLASARQVLRAARLRRGAAEDTG